MKQEIAPEVKRPARSGKPKMSKAAAKKDCGWIRVSRCIEAHEVVGFGLDGAPYSPSEAWQSLILLAAFKERTLKIGRDPKPLKLGRGQLATSERFLAERWSWTRSKVHRFLTNLANHSMLKIEPQSGTLPAIINILNYEKYQTPEEAPGAVSEPQIEPLTAENRTKEKELLVKNGSEVSEDYSKTIQVSPGISEKPKSDRPSKKRKPISDPSEPVLPIVADADKANAALAEVSTGSKPALVIPDVNEIVDKAVAMWNALAVECSLPKARVPLSDGRRKRLKARVLSGRGLDDWASALHEIRRTKFLRGKAKKMFVADLEFACQEKSYERLCSGFYSAMEGLPPVDPSAPFVDVAARKDAEVAQYEALAVDAKSFAEELRVRQQKQAEKRAGQ